MPASRLSLLCNQTVLTGIDFIQVVEPFVQTVLRVFFVVEPAALTVPLVDGTLLVNPLSGVEAGPLLPEAALVVTIVSTETGAPVTVASRGWRVVNGAAGLRQCLEISVLEPGDFAIHRLTIVSPLLDPFFNDRDFSFKQGCPSLFDCRDECAPEPGPIVDVAIDYLARDFESFRTALLDFAAAHYPMWSERIVADQAVMLFEIIAALGDEFAWTQDFIARELTLESALQRRSRSALARLVDYLPDPGNAATVELAVFLAASTGGMLVAPGARAWALPEGHAPVPFTIDPAVFDPDAGTRAPWHHDAWNRIPLHAPDGQVECLERGATSAWLATGAPLLTQLPPGSPIGVDEFWVGRRAILRRLPIDPSEPARAHAVTITGISRRIDTLVLTGGLPTPITEIRWDQPLPWPLPIAESEALLNIVPALAGTEIVEHFRTGSDAALLARYPGLSFAEQQAMLALPRAIEREGVFDPMRGGAGRILRQGLLASETRGLGWSGARDPLGIGTTSTQVPRLTLNEVTAPLFAAVANGDWQFERDLLAADLDSQCFTLEEGMWRTVVTHQTQFSSFTFGDYAGNQGWTLRFGDGDIGRPPADGSIFEARYFTAEGSAANFAADTVTHLAPPPNSPPGGAFAQAIAITNPLPILTGRDEETPEDIRINAPEAWRVLPLRAVRPEDYAAIVERLPWVQRASAVTAWTGSWPTDFVTADPLGGVDYSGDEAAQLAHVVDCVRLATRDARTASPDYLDIDLAVDVCVAPDAYTGDVLPNVIAALAPPGLFDPDNFSFGEPLYRSRIEAAVQAVPGVKGVDAIRIRVRRRRDWQDFSDASLMVGPRQIIRMQNDPLLPSRGALAVSGHGGAA